MIVFLVGKMGEVTLETRVAIVRSQWGVSRASRFLAKSLVPKRLGAFTISPTSRAKLSNSY